MFLKSKRFLSLFLCAVLTLAAFSPVFGEISSESTGTKFFSDIDTEKVIAFLQQPAGDTGYCNGEILRITRGLPPVYNGEFNYSFFNCVYGSPSYPPTPDTLGSTSFEIQGIYEDGILHWYWYDTCLLYTSPSPRD